MIDRYMKIPGLILVGTITLILLLLPSCSSEDSTSLDQQPLSPDAELGKQVIIDFWNAFNSYDLEKCLSYLGPTYDDKNEQAYIDEITITAADIIFSDSCTDFSNWLAGSDWEIGDNAFYGNHGGDEKDRYLTLKSSLDMISYSGQTVTISWDQWEYGSLEFDDVLYFAFSGDDGDNWSDNIQAFSGKIGHTPQSFSYGIPTHYLTSEFKMRFYLNNFAGLGGPAGIQRDLQQFEMGRALGVKMVPTEFAEYPPLEDGRLDIRFTLKVKPAGLSKDRYQRWYMEKINDVWKISYRDSDPDRTPPQSPGNPRLTVVNANQVDLTWVDRSSRETGYRLERALHTAFDVDLITVILPADTESYSDTTTVGGVIYYYRIFAFSEAGDSASSGTYPARMPGS
jgi:hypothetical protein